MERTGFGPETLGRDFYLEDIVLSGRVSTGHRRVCIRSRSTWTEERGPSFHHREDTRTVLCSRRRRWLSEYFYLFITYKKRFSSLSSAKGMYSVIPTGWTLNKSLDTSLNKTEKSYNLYLRITHFTHKYMYVRMYVYIIHIHTYVCTCILYTYIRRHLYTHTDYHTT